MIKKFEQMDWNEDWEEEEPYIDDKLRVGDVVICVDFSNLASIHFKKDVKYIITDTKYMNGFGEVIRFSDKISDSWWRSYRFKKVN